MIKWGDTPIGLEMARVFNSENGALLNFVSAVTFDHRELLTAHQPKVQGVFTIQMWWHLISTR